MRAIFAAIGLVFLLSCSAIVAQSPNASIRGIVLDPDGRAVPDAEIVVVNDVTRLQYVSHTNDEGIYLVGGLPPGPYRIQVSKIGFNSIIKPDLMLNVQDAASLNFTLSIGAASVTVTVEGGAPMIDTTDATVSTVVDRQFAENLPLNGRSFQALIYLTPGVVATPVNQFDGGQFSVNGQRASSNYWTVDGVSANIGVSATPTTGNGLGGALGSFSVLGGTNSLVSVDAMQEFRIQTSTFAPEFGRTPGGQIAIVTRSGSNQWHGTAFEYLRNDALDANDWFANNAGLARPEERQNDFGGTVSGPILKDHTFFFFSYEGLRLRLPQVALDTVPDLAARQNAAPAMQPYFNAFPFDPRQPDLGNGIAQYDASFSNAATLDAYSVRVDHKLSPGWNLFGRYNYSPSELVERGAGGALSVVTPSRISTQTATVGAVWSVTPALSNDLRFNYSRSNASSREHLDDFGGAVPLTSLLFPGPFTEQDSFLVIGMFALKGGNALGSGRLQESLQRQINVVDGLAMQKGRHGFKGGIDYRRLSPVDDPRLYVQTALFFDLPSAESGTPFETSVSSGVASTFLFRNLGLYVQDTWRVASRLTLTYGLRWDVDFAPGTLHGPNIPAVTGFNLNNLANLALAPTGNAPFHTTYDNFAPRLGAAYQFSQSSIWPTVLRGGIGVFYDLATSEAGNLVVGSAYPFGASTTNFGGTFPLNSAAAVPPTISPASLANCCSPLAAFDPRLELPYTLQWNVSMEQGLGSQQSLSATYVGSAGRRLLQTSFILSPNPNLYAAKLLANTASSDYSALQIRFQRRLSRGLQALASYAWSHSIDDASAGSNFVGSNTYVPSLGASGNRASSDFDVRNAFSAGVTYDVPSPKRNAWAKAILDGWSTENLLIATSALPVDVFYGELANGALLNAQANVRPDRVAGQPLYLYGSDCIAVLGPPCAGGKGLNPSAFTAATSGFIVNGVPVRQGDLGRNALRGFGATQWDFAVHRDFLIHERWKLQFRAELFNVLNHPNFGQPSGDLGNPQAQNPQFGQAQATLGQTLSGAQFAGSVGSGSFNPLYQIGGPRSVQFALKLSF